MSSNSSGTACCSGPRPNGDWAVELDPDTDASGFWYEIFQDREDFAFE
ncbi:hypothetical protein [Kitasatospora camelliae]|uniref:Uncharacterized protein n=1 Tax=Kitasatospora camelliae TaxID=3156397 RepID=A0AAU8JXK8_9ACTN